MSNISKVRITKERIAAEGSTKIFTELLEAQQKDIFAAITAENEKTAKMIEQQFSALQRPRTEASPAIKAIFKRYMENGEFEKAMNLADTFDGLEV